MMLDEMPKKRAVGYIRVSTGEQRDEGYSLQAQRKNIETFSRRNDYELVDIYADEGISGKNIKKRPALQKLIEDAKHDKFDVVIIWKLSRLSRALKDVLNISDLLIVSNVELRSISESFDITTSSGNMMLRLLGIFAEFERSQISENVQVAMKSLVKNNHRFAGGRMLGYISSEDESGQKALVVEPEEAKIVQTIFALSLEGKGYRSIANTLNKMDMRTVKGNPFSSVAVRDILMNPTYSGKLRYNRYENWETKRRKGYNPNYILVEGNHEPIISPEDFEKVQVRIGSKGNKPNWNNRGENILTGLLKCPECGGSMVASSSTNTLKDGTKKKFRYYSCANFRNKGATVCHANSIRADFAEQYVLERLREVITYPDILAKVIEELNQQLKSNKQPWDQEQKLLERECLSLEKKIQKWQDLLMDSPDLFTEIKERITSLRNELQEKEQRLTEVQQLLLDQGDQVNKVDTERAFELVGSLIQPDTPKKTIKAILLTFVDRITFEKETKNNLQIHVTFDQSTIEKLNTYTSKEPTAGKSAVGSLTLKNLIKVII